MGLPVPTDTTTDTCLIPTATLVTLLPTPTPTGFTRGKPRLRLSPNTTPDLLATPDSPDTLDSALTPTTDTPDIPTLALTPPPTTITVTDTTGCTREKLRLRLNPNT